MQDDKMDELHFEINRVPVWTSVPLNEDQKLEQN